MIPSNRLNVYTISIGTSVILGTIWHRISSDWGALVNDVGRDGAWVVSILYYGMYGSFISIGAMLSAVTLKKFNKTLNKITIGISALLSIVILEIYLKTSLPQMDVFWNIVALLIPTSWIINSIIAPDIWMHNERVHGGKKLPRDP